MGDIFVVLVIVAVGVIISLIYWRRVQIAKREHDIVECGSCQNRMTLATFRERGGCPRCGSDIFTRTGQRADRDNRI